MHGQNDRSTHENACWNINLDKCLEDLKSVFETWVSLVLLFDKQIIETLNDKSKFYVAIDLKSAKLHN